jgi:hypothetical protein
MTNHPDTAAVLIADRHSRLRGHTSRRQRTEHVWTPPRIIEPPAIIHLEERELADTAV